MTSVEEMAAAQLTDGLGTAMQLFVSVGGEAAVDTAVGRATPDTRFLLFSASKPLTAVLVHLLVQRGLLSYDDLVADRLPAFQPPGVTLRHLFLHQAGLIHSEAVLTAASFADWPAVIEAIATTPPSSPPGERTEYHPFSTYALLGAVVEAVTGEPFAEVFEREVAAPLGMTATTWGRPSGEGVDTIDTVGLDEVMAEAMRPWMEPPGDTAVNPAGSAWSTARDMGRFYDMLRCRGRLPDGRVLLEPEVVDNAVALHAPWAPGGTFGFGLGFFVGVDPAMPGSRGTLVSASTFGHPGFCSTLAQCDPERELVMVFLADGAPQQEASDRRFAALADAAVSLAARPRAAQLWRT